MKGSKWPSKVRIQISIIVVLVFLIWIVLQNPARWAEREGEMSMKIAVGVLALLFATSAFAQSAPPKSKNNPAAQARPVAPIGCKLVGTVKGTKIWAGDCVDAAELRGAAPSAEVPPQSLPAAAAGAIPPSQKQ
jgi:hypothetical protein